jgi:Domain of unknown function (DUF1839)
VRVAAIRTMDPQAYIPHELHLAERAWGESNCYADVWIEVLHSLGCDPYACLPFVFAIDWEGDQFTFFKPPHADLTDLYGIEVEELNVYRSLLENAREQLRAGRLVLTETDSFFLPDTVGNDYRSQHTKTTIGIQEIDVEARTLGYFHNSGYHSLAADDFVAVFRLASPPDPAYMPLFAELVRTARVMRLRPDMLVARSISLMKRHLARRPVANPGSRFGERIALDLERLQEEGLGAYHIYAFATIRQLGSAFELGALYLRWLTQHGEAGLDACAEAFGAISGASKALILKMARAVGTGKNADLRPMLWEIERCWDFGTKTLARRYSVA